MKLAVIPARGGSKRIPRKNIRDFCGKPIIAWSIQAAIASGCFDRVIVSTDDSEIAEVAQTWGAEVPFMRPEELSSDHAGTVPVIRHAIEWYMGKHIDFDQVCCIYATAPFVTPSDLINGLEILNQTGSEYAFSVTSYSYPIQRALKINEKRYLQIASPEYINTRSQDLEEMYHDAGQFYWGISEVWRKEQHMFMSKASPVILPRYKVQDIDTMEDWRHAELMFKLIQQVSSEKNTHAR